MHPEEAKIKQYLSKYQNPEITRQDVLNALNHYRGLSSKLDTFVFNNGSKMDLFTLEGTIPVSYKGTMYNIPVCIWVMDTHPNNAPMCYVRPTPDMQIKVSEFVDHYGKIYLPYLHDWVPNSSDLLGLIQVMIVTFGDQPPVYAKQRAEVTTPYPTHSYMPMPGVSAGSSSTSYNPPYPTNTGYQPTQQVPYPYTPYNNPYPPNNPTSSGLGYPVYPPGNTHGYPPYPTGFPSSLQTSPPSSNTANSSGTTGTITEEHIKASLLSAVEDKELTQGKNKLDDILSRLDKEQVELDKNITILKDKNQELEKAIERMSEQQPLDVDEAVTTTAPLYKQLLNAFAEEAATEDAIYYMGEALRRGVIDLDVFLKQVRSLSRKQFMLRALMHKCRQKAGLAG
ncbi:hypothetical protein L9F63_011604 [Diploptera punctata]|uniref:Tumor susceptibility gene 101 protein n=1 Tax=Diploptera punctata TaxID=6984 RepID=A0AAD8AEI3_DIPPU|nr:hypothetical protein L9F63_011604 [Diploptera punctata]